MKTFKHYHSLTLNFIYCLYDNNISGYTVLTARNDQLTGRVAELNFVQNFGLCYGIGLEGLKEDRKTAGSILVGSAMDSSLSEV
jgi:hypothetical protein